MNSRVDALTEVMRRAASEFGLPLSSRSVHPAMTVNDLLFLERVLQAGLDPYLERLRDIGVTNREHVLDAGCGFGQWSLVMSTLNTAVTSVDSSRNRVAFLARASQLGGLSNLSLLSVEIENSGLPSCSFDFIFCYSTLYSTNVPRALSELFRLLKPGGRIYIATNAPGWYVMSLLEPKFEAEDYDPRQLARDAFDQASILSTGGTWTPGKPWMLTSEALRRLLEEVGLRILHLGPEGSIPLLSGKRSMSRYQDEYFGMEVVLEALAERPL